MLQNGIVNKKLQETQEIWFTKQTPWSVLTSCSVFPTGLTQTYGLKKTINTKWFIQLSFTKKNQKANVEQCLMFLNLFFNNKTA